VLLVHACQVYSPTAVVVPAVQYTHGLAAVVVQVSVHH
jgi:hypothetical protein